MDFSFNLAQLYPVYIVLLPGIVSFIAGLLRQDKLPPLVNEAIAHVLVFLAAGLNAFFGGKITGNVAADFILIAGYSSALASTKPFSALQSYLQSNWLSFGAHPEQAANPSSLHLSGEVQHLAMLVAQELQRLGITFTPAQSSLQPQQTVVSGSQVSQGVQPQNAAQAQFQSVPGVSQQSAVMSALQIPTIQAPQGQ